ncbi:MAG: potassium transporter Kup [Vicinamibacterales bacterium]
MTAARPMTGDERRLGPLALGALGVVYGDIGTSPLYAIRECFFGPHAVEPTVDNVLGVLSLIVYALVVVISIKYVSVVMQADNRGEGGILALTALLPGRDPERRTSALVLLGLFGAALLYGDGMITPAITVLSAVEGLNAATPLFEPYVVPVAVAILVGVFSIQRHGTERVGRMFGPIMLVWFATLAALGASWLSTAPFVLGALDPTHAVRFLTAHGWHGVVVMGAVFLVVTGGEALYADMGHFGRRPISVAWFALVLPALLLNYFGQGALLLAHPEAAANPFFALAPPRLLMPMVALATLAAIIASQALISGAFSLTQQAVQLGYAPRLTIDHTSSSEAGQIYSPEVNKALMVCTLAVVVGFGSSAALAAAYGIAVTLTMIITALLLHAVAVHRWQWPAAAATAMTGLFLTIDLTFLAANSVKIGQGGWLPLVVGAALFTLMTTWKAGRRLVAARLDARAEPIEAFLAGIQAAPPVRVPGTAVFMTAQPRGTPAALIHNLRHNKVLHEHVITLLVTTMPWPYVDTVERCSVRALGSGLYAVTLYYGFMQEADVPAALRQAALDGLPFDADDVTYFLGRETLIRTDAPGMSAWREELFIFMAKNARRATGYFRLPADKVVELGVQVEI